MAKGQIIHADSQKWLAKQPDNSVPNVITGICDMDEINMNLDNYLVFFTNMADLIFKKLDPKGYAIFIQTDRKVNRQWIDKSYYLTDIAMQNEFKLVWHKIVLHREVERCDLHRPCYAHMLCYTKLGTSGAAFPDVLPVSKKLYKNGTPIRAAEEAVKFIARYNKKNTTILDPFVGKGTIVAVANKYGLNAVGIDIDEKQVKEAENNIYGPTFL